MSNSFQHLTIVGNLGRDPEMRFTPSGQPVCTFSLATTRVYSNQGGEKKEETTWFRVTTWGKQAETCNQFLKKGSKVAVLGRLIPDPQGNPRVWNKQDGTPSANFEVNAETVHFLGGGSGNGSGQAAGEEGTGEEIPW